MAEGVTALRRSAIAAASAASSSVHARVAATAASACTSPPIPLCIPSRSHSGSVAAGVSGIHGPPSSYRTWSSTHRHAASASSRSGALMAAMLAPVPTIRLRPPASEST